MSNSGNGDYRYSPRGNQRTLLQTQNAMIGDADRIELLAVGKESEHKILILKKEARILAKSGDFSMSYRMENGKNCWGEKEMVVQIQRD